MGNGFYPEPDQAEEDSVSKPQARRRVVDPGPSKDDRRQLDRIVQQRVAPLTSKIAGVSEDLGSMSRQLTAVMDKLGMMPIAPPEDGDKGAGLNPDVTWPCRKCGARLGYYDPNNGVLRTWMAGHRVWMHAGPGGWVKTICISCSEENWVRYEPTGPAGEIPVVDDEITLDVPMLLGLLQAAEQSEHGYVTVRVLADSDPEDASDPRPM